MDMHSKNEGMPMFFNRKEAVKETEAINQEIAEQKSLTGLADIKDYLGSIADAHPAAVGATQYLNRWISHDIARLSHLEDSLVSATNLGNKNAEKCLETLRKLMRNEDTEDLETLGLAWTVRNLDELREEAPPIVTEFEADHEEITDEIGAATIQDIFPPDSPWIKK